MIDTLLQIASFGNTTHLVFTQCLQARHGYGGSQVPIPSPAVTRLRNEDSLNTLAVRQAHLVRPPCEDELCIL